MSATTIIVRGTLTPDGNLELDHHPDLPAGPVEVTIRQLISDQVDPNDWWKRLQEARARLERSGHRFQSKEEIDAYIEDLRSDREDGAKVDPKSTFQDGSAC